MLCRDINCVIWDLDGTLVDSASDLGAALNCLLSEYSLPPLPLDTIRGMIGNGVAKLVERGFKARGQEIGDMPMASLVQRFMTIYAKCASDQTTVYAGVRTALQAFSEAGVRQAICTNKPEQVSRQIIEVLELGHYFDALVGGDTTGHKKPHPASINRCLDALRSTAQESILIGDSSVDVAAARAVGMPIALVTHGYAREPHDSLGADFLVSDLSALPHDLGLSTKTAIASS